MFVVTQAKDDEQQPHGIADIAEQDDRDDQQDVSRHEAEHQQARRHPAQRHCRDPPREDSEGKCSFFPVLGMFAFSHKFVERTDIMPAK